MKCIENILLCGLGGVGCVCATKIYDNKSGNLKILVDKSRYDKYTNEATYFNEKKYNFDIITPDYKNFKADLIIIATKNDGLNFVINNISNFINPDTIIISLLNGIHSEEKIAQKYGWHHLLISFYLGHSCEREKRHIYQDGIYNIVIGSKENKNENLEKVKQFFDKSGIHYYIPDNINNDYWKKFMINIGINQLSAATGLTLKEIKQNKENTQRMITLMKEAETIAEKEGISEHKTIFNSAVKFLLEEIEDAKTSMLQDIQAGRKTEVDIFAGELINLAAKHKIDVPENRKIYSLIKEKETLVK